MLESMIPQDTNTINTNNEQPLKSSSSFNSADESLIRPVVLLIGIHILFLNNIHRYIMNNII